MSRIEIKKDHCKGCLLCTTVCPVDILAQSQTFNKHGYKIVEVATPEKCIGCAACGKMCPDFCITVYKTRKAKD